MYQLFWIRQMKTSNWTWNTRKYVSFRWKTNMFSGLQTIAFSGEFANFGPRRGVQCSLQMCLRFPWHQQNNDKYAPDPATPTVAAPAPMNLAAESMSLVTEVVWKERMADSWVGAGTSCDCVGTAASGRTRAALLKIWNYINNYHNTC